ncbi:MAG: cystathionine beta-lyase [Pseudomonadota bacterium]
MKKSKSFSVDTELMHLGREPAEHYGFVNTPIYRGSTVLFPTMDDFVHLRGRYDYGRIKTPISEALDTAWASLCKAAGAVTLPSGVAAITVALLSCLKAGDRILVTDSVYAPTRRLCDKFLTKYGIEADYYDPMIGADIAKLFTPNTKAVFVEAPGSLTFEVQDIPAIAKVAHDNGALVLMDNTWATPLYFSPHEHGVDLAIEAGTKYLCGHSDVLMGLVSANEKAWPALKETHFMMGMCASADDQFLALRGMRTMSVRLKQQGEAALNIARWLSEQPEVARVLHPALPCCPGHEFWKRDFTGACGLFAIELQKNISSEAIAHMVDGLELFGIGASWGGFESLIIPFDCKIRTTRTCEPKGSCLRIHIGLEDEKDLIADLQAGFVRLQQTKAA